MGVFFFVTNLHVHWGGGGELSNILLLFMAFLCKPESCFLIGALSKQRTTTSNVVSESGMYTLKLEKYYLVSSSKNTSWRSVWAFTVVSQRRATVNAHTDRTQIFHRTCEVKQ